jgi:hypothetical protein
MVPIQFFRQSAQAHAKPLALVQKEPSAPLAKASGDGMIFRRLPSVLRFALTPAHGRRYARMMKNERSSPQAVDSIVIPCYGAGYVTEAILAARFADRSQVKAREILIVTDQPAAAFGALPDKVQIITTPPPTADRSAYKATWQSRVLKITAPLKASGETVLMIDSDLMLLRELTVMLYPNTLLGSFRKGRMAAKLKDVKRDFPEMRGVRRPFLETHINSGFLVAYRATWEQLCPLWLELFLSIWTGVHDRLPTDQIALAIALDKAGLLTGDLGILANWPVTKQTGGRTMPIPRDVIGAHGGFPLGEYEKLLLDRDAPLTFLNFDQLNQIRYEKR